MDLIQIAKEYIKAGCSVIPVNENKIPTVPKDHPFFSRVMTDVEVEKYFKKVFGIGIVAGGVWQIEIIDFDLKYDLSGTVMSRYKELVGEELIKKVYLQQTRSGGYHMIYKCDKFEPNQKLALRYTTEEEKYKVYAERYVETDSHHEGFKAACNHKTLVLIETRGGTQEKGGGYALIAPTPMYKPIGGKINKITPEERDILIESARQLNEVHEFKKDYSIIRTIRSNNDDNPFEKYNEKYDGVDLLLSHGWTAEKPHGNQIRLKRPGQTHSNSSGIWNTDKKFLKVFSTSTSFDVSNAYSAVDLFVELECAGDTREAYKKLKEMGL